MTNIKFFIYLANAYIVVITSCLMDVGILSPSEVMQISGMNLNYLNQEAGKIKTYLDNPTPEGKARLDLTLRDREVSSSQVKTLISLLEEDIPLDLYPRIESYKNRYSGQDYELDFLRNHLTPIEEGYARIFLYVPEGKREIPEHPSAPVVEKKFGCPYFEINNAIQAIETMHESSKTEYYLNEHAIKKVETVEAFNEFLVKYFSPWGAGARIFIEKRLCPSRGRCELRNFHLANALKLALPFKLKAS